MLGIQRALGQAVRLLAMLALPLSLALSLALPLIKRFEGCVLTAYPDPGTGDDPWTIGYGATGEGIEEGVVWTQAQADNRLLTDAARFERGVLNLLTH